MLHLEIYGEKLGWPLKRIRHRHMPIRLRWKYLCPVSPGAIHIPGC